LKPSIFLTPFSLNTSAAAIPPANDLCICSAVCWKSNPVTAATLPVISNILESLSASPATTARFPDAACICSSEKGTLAAKFAITSNAFAPSVVEPNNCFNLTFKSSILLPVETKDFITRPAPIVANAPLKENTALVSPANLPLIPLKACLVLSCANMFIFKFCAIIF